MKNQPYFTRNRDYRWSRLGAIAVFLALVLISCGDPKKQTSEVTSNDNDATQSELDLLTKCQTWQQADSQQVVGATDVLFVIDSSVSMQFDQENLMAGLGAFFDLLADSELTDFQMGVTTMEADVDGVGAGADGVFDDGQLLVQADAVAILPELAVQPYVDSSMPINDVIAAMKKNIIVGANGSGFEAGSEAAMRSLDPLGPSAVANAGFLREDANLVIIMLTDEDDDTRNIPLDLADPTGQKKRVSEVVDFFDTLKGAGNWSVNVVYHLDNATTDPPTTGALGCFNDGADEVGFFYKELVVASGGLEESLCNGDPDPAATPPGPDLDAFLNNLAESSFDFDPQTVFNFSSGFDPDPTTIVVTNVQTGEAITTDDWNYLEQEGQAPQIVAASDLLKTENIEFQACFLNKDAGEQ